MAARFLHDLIVEARTRWSLCRVAIYHRTGMVRVREQGVIIVVSSEHRQESLNAVQFLINELKARCPIWKKEYYADGSEWKANGPC